MKFAKTSYHLFFQGWDKKYYYLIKKDGKIIFGSRTKELGDEDSDIGGNWKRCIQFIKERLGNKRPEGLIFYGECCVKHSLSYDWEKIPPYLGFDIFGIYSNKFLDYETKSEIFKSLGLPIVPLVKKCEASEIKNVDDKFVPQSFYVNNVAEGVVFKNYKRNIFAKYVVTKFKEVNKAHFGTPRKFAENDVERLVATYCTNARIDKIVFKLVDEGHSLDMSIMEDLPHRVYTDIMEENWQEIVFSRWSVNFQEIRKQIATRCQAVLKQIIVNNALNKK